MPNDLFDDVSVLTTIERLQHNNLLHRDDLSLLRQRLHTEWAKKTAEEIAAGRALDADSESILRRFSMAPNVAAQ